MARRETKREGGGHPASTHDIDKTESGPSRLHAPGKPHEVESGPSRKGSLTPGRTQHGQQASVSAGVRATATHDAAESGPARIGRYHK